MCRYLTKISLFDPMTDYARYPAIYEHFTHYQIYTLLAMKIHAIIVTPKLGVVGNGRVSAVREMMVVYL